MSRKIWTTEKKKKKKMTQTQFMPVTTNKVYIQT